MARQNIEYTDTARQGTDKLNSMTTELYTLSEVSVTGAASLTSSAIGKIHVCTGTSANYTVDLPTAVGNSGVIIFKGAAALTKVVTIQGVSGQTIDGESDRKIASTGMIAVMSDGANWVVVNEVGSWIPYTPVLGGWSSDPAISRAEYFRVGKMVTVSFITSSQGTSNATTKTVTVPFNSDIAVATGITTHVTNNNVISTIGGLIATRAGSNTLDIYRDLAALAWTASGNCRISFHITYRMA